MSLAADSEGTGTFPPATAAPFHVEWPPLEKEDDEESTASSAADEQIATLERAMSTMKEEHESEIALLVRMQNDFFRMQLITNGDHSESGCGGGSGGDETPRIPNVDKLRDFGSKLAESLMTDLGKASFDVFKPSFQNALAAKCLEAARILVMSDEEWRAASMDTNFQKLDGWLANSIRPCLDQKSAKVQAFFMRLNAVPFAGASGWVMWRELEKSIAFKDHEEIENGVSAFKKKNYISSDMYGEIGAPKLELAAAQIEAEVRRYRALDTDDDPTASTLLWMITKYPRGAVKSESYRTFKDLRKRFKLARQAGRSNEWLSPAHLAAEMSIHLKEDAAIDKPSGNRGGGGGGG